MKKVLLFLLLAATMATSGCALMSDEDRDFYGKGWIRPSDLDKPAPSHMPADPSHPEQNQAAARTAPATSDAPWLIPEQAPQ